MCLLPAYGDGIWHSVNLSFLGGSVHTHTNDETCYDNELHFFHLKCRKWIPLSALSQLSQGSSADKPKIGRYSHAAVARDSTLMIIGGYSGVPRGDMQAYKLPTSVAMVNVSSNIPGSHCGGYKTGQTCKADPNCGWCNTGTCFALKDASKCSSSNWEVAPCPGSCGVHGTCTTCLTWGSVHTPNCGWCVQDSQCYSLSTPQGACEKLTSQNAAKLRGWWGTEGQFLSGNVDQCRKGDYPPGLIQIVSSNTADPKYPDDVQHVLTTDLKLIYDSLLTTMTKTSIGFVYPFKYAGTPYDSSCSFNLYMNVQYATSSLLYVSKDENKSNEVNKLLKLNV